MKHAVKRKRWVKWLSRTPVTVAGAFLLCLLAFGFVLLIPFITEWMVPDEVSEEALGERGVRRSVWVVLHDGDRLTGMVKLISDTRTMTMTAIGYPPQTEIIDDVTLTTAATLYRKQGERAIALIEELPVLSLPVGGAATLMGQLSGNMPITLPQSVGELPAGSLALRPLQVAMVLKFDGWEQGGVGQAWAHAQLTATFLNRALSKALDLDAAFGKLTAVCDSRLNVSQLAAVRDELSALGAANGGMICQARVVSGYMTGIGENQRYVCK